MRWRFVTDNAESVSLHDREISGWIFGNDIICVFEDGFDVFSDSPQNGTGRHKHTGKAEVILKNAELVSGELSDDEGTRKLTKDDLPKLELDILNFKRLPDLAIFACDAFKNGRGGGFCELEFSCSEVVCRWNEFTEDSWFQE